MRHRSPAQAIARPNRTLFLVAAALLATTLLLGGGGSTSPLANLLIELLGLTLLIGVSWRPRDISFSKTERASIILLALIVATPFLQLVPLPPAVWHTLPGRETAFQIEEALGSGAWHPLSIDPEATWLAALFLIPAAAIFLATLKLHPMERRRLAALIVLGALLSLALAAFQLASGPGALRLYNGRHEAIPTGLFVNRNHQADLLLIGMITASALIGSGRATSASLWLWGASGVAFSVGVLATASRTGFLLLPLAIIASTSFIPLPQDRRRRVLVWGAAAAAGTALVLAVASTPVLNVVGRFGRLEDDRFQFWPDSLRLSGEYLPLGSGAGTFSLAFGMREDLNRLTRAYINHVHNDYLQILVETGLWGAGLTILFLGGFAFVSLRRGLVALDPLRRAAFFSILILLVHSAVDYPLRMLGLLTVFSFFCALIVACDPGEAKPNHA